MKSAEVLFFRMLNQVVEPLVRAGLGSPRIVPSGFVVVESVGRKSGKRYRTPLAATRIQGHVIVGTFRGERSQWVRNLAAQPLTRFWLAGRPREARAFTLFPGKRYRAPKSLPRTVRAATDFLAPYTKAGWAFAVLSPRAKQSQE